MSAYDNPTRKLLLESGLFMQVEPEFIAEHQSYATLINRERGVVAVCRWNCSDMTSEVLARLFFDFTHQSSNTYYSSGRYNCDELQNWLIPVMKSDRAWAEYMDQPEYERDLTLALDYV